MSNNYSTFPKTIFSRQSSIREPVGGVGINYTLNYRVLHCFVRVERNVEVVRFHYCLCSELSELLLPTFFSENIYV